MSRCTMVFAAILTIFTTAADAVDLDIRRDIEFARPQGESLKLDAYLQKSSGAHAAVVFVHGGGFVSGDKADYSHDLLDPLTTAGLSVISVNYRLAPKHPFPAATDDVKSAIAYLHANGDQLGIDPRRLVLLGPSAGGLIVSHVGATFDAKQRVAAVVSLYGEHDLVLRASENPCCVDGRAIPRPAGGCISGGLAALLGFSAIQTPAHEKLLREASAAAHVTKDMPPYLLIHGTRDFGVPFEQSVAMQHAMSEAGAECTLVGIVGGGHGGWERLPQWEKERRRMVDFVVEKTRSAASKR